MSSTDLNTFLKALDAVKNDYTCGVCSSLCKKPVTLSKCFHLICAEHFDSLKTCPTCNINLEGCTTYVDERLESCINSAKELDQMFLKFRPEEESHTKTEKVIVEDIKKNRKQRKVQEKAKDKPEKDIGTTSKVKPLASTSVNSKHDTINKTEHNTSIFSNVSSKVNKTIEKRNNKGETLLHVACRLGKVDKVTELLNQGAITNTKDNAGWTPLHEAVQNGHLDLVRLLLQYNTLIDVPGQNNETPLHEAVRYNQADIAEELIKNGADINARNCKGETPLQLANNKMKEVLKSASDNIIQTQSLNITMISEHHIELDSDDIRVYCTSQFRTVANKIKILAKHHSNFKIEAKFTKNVTHLIVDAEDDGICQSSLDVLQGIVHGIWIVSAQWISKSSEEKLEPFHKYEIKGVGAKTYTGPKNSRYNKYKQLPGIFNGCHFYFHNFTARYEVSKSIVLTKAILQKLVTDAGGVVLRRVPNPESIPDEEKLVPYHAKKDGKLTNCSHYIIFKDLYEPMYNMSHLKALPIGWLIECLEKYELCEPW